MAILPLLTEPDPRLHVVCTPVETVDEAVRALLDDMVETMYASQGIGLAAPQIDVQKRLIVMDVSLLEGERQFLKMINPHIFWASDQDATYPEGCLSVPDHYADVTRPAEVHVDYLDGDGKAQKFIARDYQSACVQHEIDHLDGILFLSHLSALKRAMILRKRAKEKKKAQSHG